MTQIVVGLVGVGIAVLPILVALGIRRMWGRAQVESNAAWLANVEEWNKPDRPPVPCPDPTIAERANQR